MADRYPPGAGPAAHPQHHAFRFDDDRFGDLTQPHATRLTRAGFAAVDVRSNGLGWAGHAVRDGR
jgi:hypothetical protein